MSYRSFQTLPDSSIHCTGLSYASGILRPEFTGSGGPVGVVPFKGVAALADGVVVVHPINNRVGANFPITI